MTESQQNLCVGKMSGELRERPGRMVYLCNMLNNGNTQMIDIPEANLPLQWIHFSHDTLDPAGIL